MDFFCWLLDFDQEISFHSTLFLDIFAIIFLPVGIIVWPLGVLTGAVLLRACMHAPRRRSCSSWADTAYADWQAIYADAKSLTTCLATRTASIHVAYLRADAAQLAPFWARYAPATAPVPLMHLRVCNVFAVLGALRHMRLHVLCVAGAQS